MSDEKELKSSDEASETLKQNGASKLSKLQILLMIVTGVSFLVNALVSLSHAYGPKDYNLAVHQAMDEFKKGFSSSASRRSVIEGGSVRVERDDFQIAKRTDPKEYAASNERPKRKPQSQIAKLSCGEYGGPTDEFAQEMVYWSDIPSDSLYVSPLRQKRGSRRQYMTFEPDGGRLHAT